jgi:hypothetical protein
MRSIAKLLFTMHFGPQIFLIIKSLQIPWRGRNWWAGSRLCHGCWTSHFDFCRQAIVTVESVRPYSIMHKPHSSSESSWSLSFNGFMQFFEFCLICHCWLLFMVGEIHTGGSFHNPRTWLPFSLQVTQFWNVCSGWVRIFLFDSGVNS